jgi:hypothetical protein
MVALAACGNTAGLPSGLESVVDTVTLYAVDGTALDLPSGLSIGGTPHAVRTDLISTFDFVFNITPAQGAVLLPTGAIHLGIGSAIQKQTVSFDAITLAPGGVYDDSLPFQLDSGMVAVMHSRVQTCPLGTVGVNYGKLEVMAIDTVARSIELKFLANLNCGYRSLEPGFPTQ